VVRIRDGGVYRSNDGGNGRQLDGNRYGEEVRRWHEIGLIIGTKQAKDR